MLIGPQAFPSGAAIRGRRAASYAICAFTAASDIAPQYTRILTRLCVPGLPLAEPSAHRYWRGVKGGSVLSCHGISLQNIREGAAQAKLIVLIGISRNDNE